MHNFWCGLNIFILIFLISCNQGSVNERVEIRDTNYLIKHADTFRLSESDDGWIYTRLHNGQSIHQQISKSNLPYKNAAVLSSSVIGYIEAIESFENVKVVFNKNWIYSPRLQHLVSENLIQDGGNAAAANLESILIHQPDVVFAFTDPNQSKLVESVKNAGIPVIFVDEYAENSPLGKTEYLKLFGVLFGKKEISDSLFTKIETDYLELSHLARSQPAKPTVFSDIMRGDIWYMPGGASLPAQLFKDAGAEYLWHNSSSSGTENLSFEQVYMKARHADFWMNAADFTTLNQLEDAYKNHVWFDAYKTGNVYSVAKRVNAEGASDYFETGTVRADRVLRDLVYIFYPELLPEHKLFYYQKLQ